MSVVHFSITQSSLTRYGRRRPLPRYNEGAVVLAPLERPIPTPITLSVMHSLICLACL